MTMFPLYMSNEVPFTSMTSEFYVICIIRVPNTSITYVDHRRSLDFYYGKSQLEKP